MGVRAWRGLPPTFDFFLLTLMRSSAGPTVKAATACLNGDTSLRRRPGSLRSQSRSSLGLASCAVALAVPEAPGETAPAGIAIGVRLAVTPIRPATAREAALRSRRKREILAGGKSADETVNQLSLLAACGASTIDQARSSPSVCQPVGLLAKQHPSQKPEGRPRGRAESLNSKLTVDQSRPVQPTPGCAIRVAERRWRLHSPRDGQMEGCIEPLVQERPAASRLRTALKRCGKRAQHVDPRELLRKVATGRPVTEAEGHGQCLHREGAINAG